MSSETESNSKKRKYAHTADAEEILPYKHWKHYSNSKLTKSSSDIDLQLESPLSSEWQRCLDIQSGEIHFYNSRTNKRTFRDPRDCGQHMSLDLELNLPCGSQTSEKADTMTHLYISSRKNTTSEIMEEDEVTEMVATVCVRCHMLVMLCKSSPTCPNCKFLHPPYQTSTDLFKPRLSLSY